MHPPMPPPPPPGPRPIMPRAIPSAHTTDDFGPWDHATWTTPGTRAYEVGRLVWYTMRAFMLNHLPATAQTNVLLSALEGIDVPPCTERTRKKNYENAMLLARENGYDTPNWTILRKVGPEGWPPFKIVALLELMYLDDITQFMTKGKPKSVYIRQAVVEWGWPLHFAGEAVYMADVVAEHQYTMGRGTTMAGINADLGKAIDDGDTRARIAARRTQAQATGILKTSNSDNTKETISDIIRALGTMAEEEPPGLEGPTTDE